METVEAVVIGAGVVGLAVARQLALAGHETLILEAEAAFGTQTSARNSEGSPRRAGIHPTGRRKARCCVRGQALLVFGTAPRGTLPIGVWANC